MFSMQTYGVFEGIRAVCSHHTVYLKLKCLFTTTFFVCLLVNASNFNTIPVACKYRAFFHHSPAAGKARVKFLLMLFNAHP